MGTIKLFALSHSASKRLPEEEKGPAQPANSRSFQPSSSSTVRAVLPAFFIIGLIYIPIGIALYISSNNIRDFEFDYTGIEASSPCYSCAKNLMWNSRRLCLHCHFQFGSAVWEQCLHVLWLIQLLPEPQMLCEFQRWQPADGRPVCFEEPKQSMRAVPH